MPNRRLFSIALISGLLFLALASPGRASTATFLPLDTTTTGNWVGVYGHDGFIIPNDASSPPAYATVTSSGATAYTWANPSSDPRALLLNPTSSQRIASTFYTGTSMSFGINLTDGKPHQVALYLMDLETNSRAETIAILDTSTSTVLDSRPLSGFQSGKYAIWTLQGNVTIKVTYTGGLNAVVGGIFFDPSAGGGSQPPPVVSITNPAAGTVSGSVNITANATAAAGMASVQFQIDGSNFGAPVAGVGPSYSMSWDTTTATSGLHALKAIATDSLGQNTASNIVNVTVSNGTSTGPAATFVKLDTATSGNWVGTYGQDGYIIPNDATVPPAYASVNTTATPYTWMASTTDPRGLLINPTSSVRIASTYYTSTSMSFDVNLTDGNVHQVALYCLDLDTSARAETISVLNASTNSVLASQPLSNFHSGVYAVWNLQGHVIIQVTFTGGLNAVVSGLFFGQNAPPPPAPVVSITSPAAGTVLGSVTLTANATSTVGIASVQFQLDGTNLGAAVTGAGPNYSMPWNTITASNGPHTLTAIATDTVGQKTTSAGIAVTVSNTGPPPTVSITVPTGGTVSATVTVTATAASSNLAIASVQFQLDGANLGSPITSAPYSMQWSTTTASNGSHNLTAIATDTIGQQTTSALISVTVANTGPTPPAATFVKLDSKTSGNWVGTYGQDGYIIPNDASVPPAYATFNTTAAPYTWLATTTDPRGLLINPTSTTRIASTYYTATSMTFDVNLTDGNVHQVALYCLDLETTARAETISILNASTNAVLASQPMSNFNAGVYAVFNLQGHVIIQVTFTGGLNAVLSGLFFGQNAPPPPAPIVSVTSPAAGTVLGTVTATANATSTVGIASVQFQLDGSNLGAPVTGAGPNYSMPWNTVTATNGPHSLTAIATDTLGQKTTSAAVAVTVSNTGPPPTVNISAPTGGTVSGSVTVTATASSSNLAIASVQFQLDGTNLGSPITTAPYTMQWSSNTASNTSHNLTAIATDTIGQKTTSAIVSVTVANTGPVQPAATFVKLDTAPTGTWVGNYGQDGFIIPNDATSLPAYATFNTTATPYTWLANTTDPRGLLINPTSTARIASTYYTSTSMTFDVNLTDGNVHQVALYCLDLETTARTETISILNASTNAVLSSQPMSNFHNGVYAVWNLQGHVTIQVTFTGGLNAVLSGIFFGQNAPPPPAPSVNITSPTAGTVSGSTTLAVNATSTIGIASVQFQLDGTNLGAPLTGGGPAYSTPWSTVTATNGPHTLTAIAKDTLGQKTTSAAVAVTVSNTGPPPTVNITTPTGGTVSATVTVTASATSPSLAIASVQFQLDGANLGSPITSPPYSMQWSTNSASNGSHNLTAIATDTIGQQTTSAQVAVTVSNTGPAQPAAKFVKFDTTTLGSWAGQYGQDGYIIANDGNLPPAYATVNTTAPPYTWFASTTDPRALLVNPTSTNRIASAFYTNSTMTFDVNLTDNQVHQVALYAVDIDTTSRAETISILNASTNAILDTQTLTSFNGGIWAVWNLQGHVTIQVTFTGGVNAVVSGLFFRSLTGIPLPSINIVNPTGGTVSGPVTISANASSPVGLMSVQFQVDNANYGAPLTVSASSYSIGWASPTVLNGNHTLGAIATDSFGQTTAATPITVNVSNGPPPTPAATFLKTDTATQGSWVGVYGPDGFIIPNDITSPPFYATFNTNGAQTFTWHAADPTTDPPGLQKSPTNTQRIGAAFLEPFCTTGCPNPPLMIDVNFVDNQTHQLAVYFVDWHHNVRTQTINVLNANTQAVLDTRTITAFSGGIYLVYNITGHVIFQIALTGYDPSAVPDSVVVSGFFFGAVAPPPPPPVVNITAPSAGAVSGTTTVTASATSTVGIGSVQFQLDNANLGSAIPGSGPYSVPWNTTTATNGSHNLTAIATDINGQSTTSAAVAVSVANSGPPPVVSLSAPATNATVSGSVTVSANATSPSFAIAKVQFQLDGSNLGSAVTGPGPLYSASWATTGASNGTHTLTAIATDTVGQTTTSAGVTVTVANTGPPPAAATFVKLDTTTSGSWVGTYGQDGYVIPNDATVAPAYATFTTAATPYTWLATTTDPRGTPINPSSTTRIASTYYTGTTMTFDVNLTDGAVHQVALYCLDLETTARAETISILNASTNAVLSSQPITNFHNGVYALWNLQGHVIIQVSYTGGLNAVLSGIFFGQNAPPPPAPVVSVTSPTAGTVLGSVTLTANATSTVGIASVQFQLDGANLGTPLTGAGPNYSTPWNTITATNGSHTLTAIATDTIGQKTTSTGVVVTVSNTGPPPTVSISAPTGGTVSNTVTITATANSPSLAIASVQFQLDGANLGSPVTGAGPNFSTQWFSNGSSNGTHNLTAIATDTVGQQTTSAQISVSVANSGPPPASAVYVNRDTSTQGSWVGIYGKDGYVIPNDVFNPPSYAVVNTSGGTAYTWLATTTDTRGLFINPTSSTRIASTYYTNTSMSFDINLTDGLPHQVALYFLDLETTERFETISILDANNNSVLNTQQMVNFHNGIYGVWNLQGHVIIKVTFNSGLNAVMSGIFFEPTTPPPPAPTSTLTAPAAGTVQGLVTLTANASSTVGVASVQFQIDGVNLGLPVTGAGPSYTTQWDTTKGTNGTHNITAIAADVVGQQTPSAAVAVTVANPPPVVGITSPTGGTLSATVPIQVTAASSVGIASIQIQLDGTNLGSPLPGPGTSFSMQWSTGTTNDGVHSLTAIATDVLGQITTSAAVSVSVANGAPPVVNITSPTGGTQTGTVTVTATASSSAGITSVQFKLDGTNLGAPATGAGPYSTSWATTSTINGPHTLTATATDSLSRSTTSAGIAVTVSNPAPTVSVTAPAANATVSGTVTLTASASSTIGLASVQFQVDGSNVGTPVAGTGPSFSFQWSSTSVTNGTHTIAAVASDTQGQKTTSAGVSVTVGNGPPPTVNMTSPAAGQVSGTVTLSATASSTVGLDSVQFQVDGTNLGAAQTGSGPYSTQWDATKVANGSHTVSAVAKDILGQTNTSSVAVTVANPPPTVGITAPASGNVSGTAVTVTANATSSEGIASVQFQLDGANLGSAVTTGGPSYSIQWDTGGTTNGSHTLTAIATDAFGQANTSAGVSVTVQNAPPTVSVTSPLANATVSAGITVTASASSPSLAIASVQFQLDGANLGSPATGAGPSYSVQWNTTAATNAAHTLTAIATDTAGQKTTSSGVIVTVANTSGGIQPAAEFITIDTTTSGNWIGVYGQEGEFIANDPAATLPAYATVSQSGGTLFAWTDSSGDTSDPRALQWSGTPPASLPGTFGVNPPRNPSTYYTGSTPGASNMIFDVNLTDGFAHLVALYAVDFDTANTRSETISVLDANTNAVLDTRQISNFSNGIYAVWNLQGHVHIRVTLVSGQNALASALFFRSFTGTPAASVSITSPAPNSVLSGPVTVTANASSSVGIASVRFQLDGADLGPAVTGTGPSYSIQWATPTVSNGSHTLTVIAVDNVEQASVSTAVPITVSNGPPPTPAATFVTADTTTQGSWAGVYGGDGFLIPADATNTPFYATVNLGAAQVFTYSSPVSASDSNFASTLLTGPATTTRIASDYFVNSGGFSVGVNLVDDQPHQLALYFQDYHASVRSQTVNILDANTNAVLDSRSISSFQGGVYLVWNVQGNVSIQITPTGSLSAVITGIFFAPAH